MTRQRVRLGRQSPLKPTFQELFVVVYTEGWTE